MITIKKIESLQGIEVGIDNSILHKLIQEIDLLVVSLKMTSYDVKFEEQLTNNSFHLVGIEAWKNKKSIHFDLICSPNDLTIKQTSFMIMGINQVEIDEIYENLSQLIKKDFGHTNDFQLAKQHDMFYARTTEESNPHLIPYLIQKMRSYI